MTRTCPNCKAILNTSSNYFCVECGFKLPENLHGYSISRRNVKKVVSKKKLNKDSLLLFKSKEFKRFFIGFVLIGISSIFIYLLIGYINGDLQEFGGSFDSQVLENNQEENDKKVYKNVVNSSTESVSGSFNQFSVVNYIPYDIDFYLEFSDFSKFEETLGFLGVEYLVLKNSLVGKVHPFYSVFLTKSEDKFIWSLIVFPADGYAGISGEYETLYMDRVESSVVISSSKTVINNVKDAKSGLAKSLNLHPRYISIKSSLPPEGKVFMLSLTDEGKDYISSLDREATSDAFYSFIEAF